jgi:hypothetical protein
MILVDDFLNPIFAFHNKLNVFARTDTLAVQATGTLSDDIQSTEDLIVPLDSNELGTTVRLEVYDRDVKELYYRDGDNPIAAVEESFIRFEVFAPAEAYAVRLSNENGPWSEWLPILPEFPQTSADILSGNSSSSQSQSPLNTLLEAYFVADNQFVVPWILSPESGDKLVSCQVLTHFGRTNTFSCQVLAVYTDLAYKVDFYADAGRTQLLTQFNGMPVLSMQHTSSNILPSDPSSLTQTVTVYDTPTGYTAGAASQFYLTITFTDKTRFDRVMSLSSYETFSQFNTFTYDFIGKGTASLIGVPLTQTNTTDQSNVYTGTLVLPLSDGVEYRDGLGVVVVNIPDPRLDMFTPPAVEVDAYNFMGLPRGQYTNTFPSRPFSVSAEDIQSVLIQQTSNALITRDQFRELYNPGLINSFLSSSNNGVRQPDDDVSSSSSEQDSSQSDNSSSSSGLKLDCGSLDWSLNCVSEPGYYKYQPNFDIFMRESPTGIIDLSDARILGVTFDTAITDVDGILVLVPEASTITQSWNGVSGAAATFVLPQQHIIFSATQTYPLYTYRNKTESWRNQSNQKTFNVSGTAFTATIVAGDTGLITSGQSASAVFLTGFNVRTITSGVTISDLRSLGFVDRHNIMRFKFYHVVTGEGHLTIKHFACNLDADQSSSSSSSSRSSASLSSHSSLEFSSPPSSSSVQQRLGSDTSESSPSSLNSNEFTSAANPQSSSSSSFLRDAPGTSSSSTAPIPGTCNFDVLVESNGSDAPYDVTHTFGPEALYDLGPESEITMSFYYDTYTVADRIQVSVYDDNGVPRQVLDTFCVASNGTRLVLFSVNFNDTAVRVQVTSNCNSISGQDNKAGWYYRITCDVASSSSSPSSFVMNISNSSSSSSSGLCTGYAPLFPYMSNFTPKNLCGPTSFVVFRKYDVSGNTPTCDTGTSSSSTGGCVPNAPLWPFGSKLITQNACNSTVYTVFSQYSISGAVTSCVDSSSSSSSTGNCANAPLWPFGSKFVPQNTCNSTVYTVFSQYSISGSVAACVDSSSSSHS